MAIGSDAPLRTRTRRRPSVLAWFVCAALIAPATVAGPAVGDEAPSWSARDADGELIRFPNVTREGPKVILFWATWCGYCRALMPELAELGATYADRGVEVYAIAFADDPDEARAHADALELPLTYIHAGAGAAVRYDVRVVPEVFVVADGIVRYELEYPEPDHPSQTTDDLRAKQRMLAAWWTERIEAAVTESLHDD